MFKATVFDSFISISVSQKVYNMAKEIFPDRDTSSGYDMENFLRMVLPQDLLDQVKMDPESSHFYAYLNLIKEDEVTERDIHNLKLWMNAAQAEISIKYITTIQDRLSKITPEVEMADDHVVLVRVKSRRETQIQ
jgi:hypothetical protein